MCKQVKRMIFGHAYVSEAKKAYFCNVQGQNGGKISSHVIFSLLDLYSSVHKLFEASLS